jgi:hypothetical protein
MPPAPTFPFPLEQYVDPAGASILEVLASRLVAQPFNGIATGIFFLAILHTFAANSIRRRAHAAQHAHDARRQVRGLPPEPGFVPEVLHFLGEVEVVFGLWAVVLLAAIGVSFGWATATDYVNHTVNYTEPMFVVVIMAVASTRPVVGFAEGMMRRLASFGGGTPASWWLAILIVGPLLGSFITEPAAMTISAMLLSRQFFDLGPSRTLRYATLGLLFVSVSIGGTLTHFAAPPVLMVARHWDWSAGFMAATFGWKAVAAIVGSTALYYVVFKRKLRALSSVPAVPDEDLVEPAPGVPAGIVIVHIAFLAFIVFEAHYPVFYIGAFLFFLGFAKATAPHQSTMDLRGPLLVGFFLAGLVTHGSLQGWWIAPVLGGLSEVPLFTGATILTAFNDNALITYLATLVPDLSDAMKYAVVAGAVTGGGLTVIANAPNPAGQTILGRHFGGGVSPLWLAAGAIVPTLIAAACFMLL